MRILLTRILRRPIAVTSLVVLMLSASAMAIVRLPVALLPSLAYPALMVWTPWQDVPPDQIEREITLPVEQTLAGVPGVTAVTGRSQLGGSLVRLDFGWNTNLDLAGLEVRQKLDRISQHLPDRAERPLVLPMAPTDRPILVLAAGATDRVEPTASQLIELKRLAEDVVARRLEQLDGIARVRVTGGFEREIRVDLDADRLASYGVDLSRVEAVLRDANVTRSGGTIQKGPFRYALEVSGEFRDAGDVATAVVSDHGRPVVRLSEVATVHESVAQRHGSVRLDGREVLLLLVERSPDANTVEAVEAARRALEDLRQELSGLSLEVVADESLFVRGAIGGVVQALLWGGLLSVMVLGFFLRRLRLLTCVAVSVPLSLALALVLFDLLGITLNLISLSGLALGIGLLVDNSIVVVENIARLRDAGLGAFDAAVSGAAEVAGAITASTLTTLAVFVPLTFVEGLAGRLFRDQSLAVACSVGASLLVASTVVPLLAARDTGRSSSSRAGVAPGLALYGRLLESCLRRPRLSALSLLACLLVTGWLASRLPREVLPESHEGRVEIALGLPADASLSLIEARSAPIEAALASMPGVAHILADLGQRDDAQLDLDPRPRYRGDLTVVLDGGHLDGGHSTESVLRALAAHPGAADLTMTARTLRPELETLMVSSSSDLVIDLLADDRAHAARVVPSLLAKLEARRELVNVTQADPEALPAYALEFDRDALVRLGASAELLEGYLEAAARGREATQLRHSRDEIPIVLRTSSQSLDELLATPVPTNAGLLPLSVFVRPNTTSMPAVLTRHQQAPVVRLLADLGPGADLSEAVRAISTVLDTELPDDVRATVGGANDAFRRSLHAVAWSLLFSVLLVYLILAAQFESFVQPLVVLSVVPVAVGGVAITLTVTGHSWNLMSLTGCVVLVGIAVNDAIIKVDFINRRRREGMPVRDALRRAGHERFRPIVMTTVTTLLGMLPLALDIGSGGSLRAPLAVAIAGGLVVATSLTLFLVPTAYQLLLPRHPAHAVARLENRR